MVVLHVDVEVRLLVVGTEGIKVWRGEVRSLLVEEVPGCNNASSLQPMSIDN